MYDAILLRYGEVGIKSRRKRPYFEKLYVSSIKQALTRANIEFDSIVNLGGRFVLFTKQVSDAITILKNVPGVQSLSPATTIDFTDLADLLSQSEKISKPLITNKIFRVSTTRSGKHDFSSMDVSRKLGEILFPFSKAVSLTHPEVEVSIEVREQSAYIFTESIPCLDGMPAASSGRVLCLFSGGLDSPVAAFQMLKRGVAIDYLFIDLVGGEESFESVARVYNHLITNFSFNQTPLFHRVDGVKLVAQITKKVNPSMRQLALKIAFYKIAEHFVSTGNYNAACNGESLSQKSSQTLPSLKFIQSQSNVFMLRPLLTFDKLEITNITEKIGTFGSSQQVKEYCNLAEGNAVTAVPIDRDLKKIFDMSEIVEETCKLVTTHKSIIPLDVSSSSVSIPEDVITYDIRLSSKAKIDPLPVDKEVYFHDVMIDLDSLDKSKKYLFVCEHGVQSQSIAYACSQRNIKAFAMSRKAFVNFTYGGEDKEPEKNIESNKTTDTLTNTNCEE